MPQTDTPSLHADSPRIAAVVRESADRAYRARIATAVSRWGEFATADLTRSREQHGIDVDRWLALSESTSNASSAAEFQRFAAALGVSARWLAIGSGSPVTPPAGWATFGSHLDYPGRLEFSTTLDPNDLMPMWERPLLGAAA